jgi:hypothetical protein
MEIDHLRLQTQERKVSLIQWRRSEEFEFALRFVDFADKHEAVQSPAEARVAQRETVFDRNPSELSAFRTITKMNDSVVFPRRF